jgi:energy-converting hydrogenase Eha subunit G
MCNIEITVILVSAGSGTDIAECYVIKVLRVAVT